MTTAARGAQLPGPLLAWGHGVALAAFLAALLAAASVSAQSVDKLRKSDEPLEINAEEGIEWNRNDKTYIARGKARAASGEVEVLADVLIAYYREPADGQEGDSEIFLLEANGNVRINSPEGSVYGAGLLAAPLQAGGAQITVGITSNTRPVTGTHCDTP